MLSEQPASSPSPVTPRLLDIPGPVGPAVGRVTCPARIVPFSTSRRSSLGEPLFGSFGYESQPLIHRSGFRDYDARWRLDRELNLMGVQTLGLGLATYIHERGAIPRIVVGHDYRAYSLGVKQALMLGLLEGGMEVVDIGLAITPMAYFAQYALDTPCVAMVTASHNENGWTGVKMGTAPGLTFGSDDMARLAAIVGRRRGVARRGGEMRRPPEDMRRTYLSDIATGTGLLRPLRIVVACGNGTAALVAPDALRRMGAEVIEMDCDPDHAFPNGEPNPEDAGMLARMGECVRATGADLGLGFDGDGDRLGVVDGNGQAIFGDRLGLILARDLSSRFRNATFVVDMKSTGLYADDPVLAANGARVDYAKTGHSHIKRRMRETGALAGFEKSGHIFLGPPLGRGYDDALAGARAVLQLLERRPETSMASLAAEPMLAWTSLTMSPVCSDTSKRKVVERVTSDYEALASSGASILGRRVTEISRIDGVRVNLEDGSWLLVRASSNKPELTVVVESRRDAADMRALFHEEVAPRLARFPEVGAYNQQV